MKTKLTARKFVVFGAVEIALALVISTSAYALNCQYQGRPDSVIRLGPGFGGIFGAFQLVNSPNTCPDHIKTIQFSGSSAVDAAIFVSTIETCLETASLLVVQNGRFTVDLHDPLTGEPGVVIGNHLATPVVNSCRIARRGGDHAD